MLATTAVAAGLGTPPWYDLIAKVIPARRRGIWAGFSRGLGSLLGIGGATLAGLLLATYPYPLGFSLCFFVAFISLAISWVSLALNREPDSTITKPRVKLSAYLRQLPTVLRRDANYLHYLIARSVAVLGGMGAGFFMVYGVDRFAVEGQMVGLLTAVLVGSQALMNVLLGALADRVGHRVILAFSALAMASGSGECPAGALGDLARAHLCAARRFHGRQPGFGAEYHPGVLRAGGSADLYRADQYLVGAGHRDRAAHRRRAGASVRLSDARLP